VAITPLLISKATGPAAVVGASVFGSTMMFLYLSSTLYHAFPKNRAKHVFQVFDHSGIFLLIAGTYTPFALTVLPNPWGWTIFGLVWGLAAIGITIKSVRGAQAGKLSTFLYLAMGWLAVVAFKPLWMNLAGWGFFWLVLGGLFYSGGVFFFAYDHRIKYSHFVWHLFVLLGTASHVIAVFRYVY
jgi:hemolysin III